MEACRLSEQLNDTAAVSESFYQISCLLERMQLVPEALYYLIQRYNLEQEVGDSGVYSNIRRNICHLKHLITKIMSAST